MKDLKNNFLVSYAQNREDVILNGFFKNIKKGFYVDVGANDPEKDSVTKFFYDRGWHGINIEPIMSYYNNLQQQRPRDLNLNIGIAENETTLNFREYSRGRGLSTFSKEMVSDYEAKSNIPTEKFIDYTVQVFPLKKVFKDNKIQKINFLKVDVEGFEYEVLKSNDWTKYRPQVLCIEANHVHKDWKKLLENQNYALVFFDGLNEYYVAKEQQNDITKFSYVTTILGSPIVSAHFNNLLKQVGDKLDREKLINQNLRSQIADLSYQAVQSARIRNLLKRFIRAVDAAVLVNINNLNKPLIRNSKPLILNEGDSLNEVLQKIKRYDLERYYSVRSNDRLMYKLINMTYIFISRSLVRTIRKMRRIIAQKGIKKRQWT